MILGIFGKCKDIFKETLNKLKGSDRGPANILTKIYAKTYSTN